MTVEAGRRVDREHGRDERRFAWRVRLDVVALGQRHLQGQPRGGVRRGSTSVAAIGASPALGRRGWACAPRARARRRPSRRGRRSRLRRRRWSVLTSCSEYQSPTGTRPRRTGGFCLDAAGADQIRETAKTARPMATRSSSSATGRSGSLRSTVSAAADGVAAERAGQRRRSPRRARRRCGEPCSAMAATAPVSAPEMIRAAERARAAGGWE